MSADHLLETLRRFFEGRAEFAGRERYIEPSQAYEGMFLPYFRSLSDEDRHHLVMLLGKVAVAEIPSPDQHRFWALGALDLLYMLSFPWPEDHRSVLLEAKGPLYGEFNSKENLANWCRWEPGSSPLDWIHGPGYALSLYRVLLVIASDAELAAPVEYLLRHARDGDFLKRLRELPYRYEGIRLSSPHQMNRDQFRQHLRKLRM